MKMRSKKRPPKQNNFLIVSVSQAFLCALMLCAAYFMSISLQMTELKPAFSDLLTEQTEAVEVFAAFKSNEQYIPKMKLFDKAAAALESLFGSKGGGYTPPNTVITEKIVMSAEAARPAKGYISSAFGVRDHPILKKQDFHTGIDIAAPLNTPVMAAYHGVVTEIGQSDIYGNYIILSHGAVKTKYAHCNEIKAKVGMVFRRGELIATVGSTGMSTGPHLHFEVRINERAIDPMYCFENDQI